jgi:hypothetical protein
MSTFNQPWLCFTILCGLSLFFQQIQCFETNQTRFISQNLDHSKCENTTNGRAKRFIAPSVAGWELRLRFIVVEPMTTPLGGEIFTELGFAYIIPFKLDNYL